MKKPLRPSLLSLIMLMIITSFSQNTRSLYSYGIAARKFQKEKNKSNVYYLIYHRRHYYTIAVHKLL